MDNEKHMTKNGVTDCEREPRLNALPQMAGHTLYGKVCDIPSVKMDPIILQQLEILRGEPITFVDIHNIPCLEISADSVREIDPIVSVVVITYNHEKYISEALAGILCQKTDFPFEIVIGEDCSTDRTREIVLEYQKKYPGHIRVLISKHNLRQTNSSNLKRTLLATRGKYVAFCEGDDYWIDEKKLKKQVEIFQKHERVYAVYTAGYHYQQDTGKLEYRSICGFEGEVDIHEDLYGFLTNPIFQQHRTCSSMFRRELFEKKHKEDALDDACLFLGDRQLWLCSALAGSLYYLNEPTSVYRIHPESIVHSANTLPKVLRDAGIVNLFYLIQNGHAEFYSRMTSPIIAQIVDTLVRSSFLAKPYYLRLATLSVISVLIMFKVAVPFRARFYIALSIQKNIWREVWERLGGKKIRLFCFYTRNRNNGRYHQRDIPIF